MRVSQELQVLDLPFDSARHVPTDQLTPTDDLHGDLLASDFVLCQLHLTKRALAQRSDLAVLIETIVSADCAW
jgi:hypothetical protein